MNKYRQFPQPKQLMDFFQDWSLPWILNFYEAEQDLVGKDYCEVVEKRCTEEEGKLVIKQYIKDLPSGIEHLLLKSYDPLFETSATQRNFDLKDVDKWWNKPSLYNRTKKIIDALSQGFLAEWIVFCAPSDEKVQRISLMRESIILEEKLTQDEESYKKWETDYKDLNHTRNKMCENWGYDKHVLYYFTRRILLGKSLNVIFYTVKHKELKLYENLDAIKEKMKKFGIAHDVQDFYCHSKYNDYAFTFEDDNNSDDNGNCENNGASDIWESMPRRKDVNIKTVKWLFSDYETVINDRKQKRESPYKYKDNEELQAYLYAGLLVLHMLCLEKKWNYPKYASALKELHGKNDDRYKHSLGNLFSAPKKNNNKNKEDIDRKGYPRESSKLKDKTLVEIFEYIDKGVGSKYKSTGNVYKKKVTLYKDYIQTLYLKFNEVRHNNWKIPDKDHYN